MGAQWHTASMLTSLYRRRQRRGRTVLLPRIEGLPQPPRTHQHLRQDGPQGTSPTTRAPVGAPLTRAACARHPRRDDRCRHVHPRRRQQDTLRVGLRRRPRVKTISVYHLASIVGSPSHPATAHCNILVYVKARFFRLGAGRVNARRSGIASGRLTGAGSSIDELAMQTKHSSNSRR